MRLRDLAVAGAAFLLGCASVPDPRVVAAPDVAVRLPPGHAEIVFARRGGYGLAQQFFIVDADGRFVGVVPKKSRLHVVVRGGNHTFVGWVYSPLGGGSSPALVTGEIEAGRVYQVQIGGGEQPMQFVSMPLSLPLCGTQTSVMKTRRVASDSTFSMAPCGNRDQSGRPYQVIAQHRSDSPPDV